MLLQYYFIFMPLHKAIKLTVYSQLVGEALFISSWPLHFETLACQQALSNSLAWP